MRENYEREFAQADTQDTCEKTVERALKKMGVIFFFLSRPGFCVVSRRPRNANHGDTRALPFRSRGRLFEYYEQSIRRKADRSAEDEA